MKILYRLEVNYYSQHYEDKCCETSTPIFSLQEGIEKYLAAITEKCIDDNSKCARVHLWEYVRKGGRTTYKTIRKNYEGGNDPI